MEYAFAMIMIALLLSGTMIVFFWVGRAHRDRQQEHEKVLYWLIPERLWGPLIQVDPFFYSVTPVPTPANPLDDTIKMRRSWYGE